MMKKLAGLLAVAVTLFAAAPALAQRPQIRPAQHVTIVREVAAPAWSAAGTTNRAPANFEDTAPRPFADGEY
ncbi:hypothetical protein JIR23_22190 [Bradyrhizobium diazoefficiens]|nr:hypothetical protein [Bradyrhizobium diazoefficiens]QQN62290.1 hypothetical protein JIR23_22190 [Bradyrhizobium diazoefficiens]